jgi:hypothetical protein
MEVGRELVGVEVRDRLNGVEVVARQYDASVATEFLLLAHPGRFWRNPDVAAVNRLT